MPLGLHRGAEMNLVGLNELTSLDRWAIERRSRALTQPTYLGGGVSLSRMLGRYKLYVDTSDVGFGSHLLLDGFWESWLTVFIARRVKPGMAVVDVGANHGYYTLLMADLVGRQGRVAAVEPNPAICRLLRRSISVNGFDAWTTVMEQAAAETAGAVQLYIPPNEPKNARVLPADAPAEASPAVVDVRAGPLADALAGWPRIDFIKIDVEGAEEAAIAGLLPRLQADRPDVVLEFNVARCSHPEQLLDVLEAIYKKFRFVDYDAEAHPVDRASLLDPAHGEDWLLSLSVR